MTSVISDLFNTIYPPVCMGCERILNEHEPLLCLTCRHDIPTALLHKGHDAKIRDLFYGRIPIELATSLFYYEKIGSVQLLIHNLKYRRHREISGMLGKWLSAELLDDLRFKAIDFVVPVPLHNKRLRQRGYNQSEDFGREIAYVLQASFRESALIKVKNTVKQAKLSQANRISEDHSPYLLNEILPEGSHILLVDDVITTGTTLTLCARELLKTPGTKISIASMAISI